MGERLLLILNIPQHQICRGRLPEPHLPPAGPIPCNWHAYKWLGTGFHFVDHLKHHRTNEHGYGITYLAIMVVNLGHRFNLPRLCKIVKKCFITDGKFWTKIALYNTVWHWLEGREGAWVREGPIRPISIGPYPFKEFFHHWKCFFFSICARPKYCQLKLSPM